MHNILTYFYFVAILGKSNGPLSALESDTMYADGARLENFRKIVGATRYKEYVRSKVMNDPTKTTGYPIKV